MASERPPYFPLMVVIFAIFVVFLYAPIITIVILSFQGPEGGHTFPMRGVSMHWFAELFGPQSIGDIWGAFRRSFALGLLVMACTVVISLCAGLAYRRRFIGATGLLYVAIASLIMPSVVVSLGIGAGFELLGIDRHWYTSGLGAHLTWTLPFGLLIMFAVFNRFDRSYEEAARDQGATPWQTIRFVVLPIIAPSLIGVALFGFTLSYDEFARTLLTAGSYNTLPLEIFGMTTNVTTPVIYALGTMTTAFSLMIIGVFLLTVWVMGRRRARLGSDAGKGV